MIVYSDDRFIHIELLISRVLILTELDSTLLDVTYYMVTSTPSSKQWEMASLVTPSYDRLMDFFTDFRFQSMEAIMMIALAGSFLTDFILKLSTNCCRVLCYSNFA